MFPEAGAAAYGTLVATAFFVAMIVSWLHARAEGLAPFRSWLLLVALGIAAHVGGRLYLLLEVGGPWTIADFFSYRVGYRQPGAILGLLVGLIVLRPLIYAGIRVGTVADVLAPATAMALTIERIGCFMLGCCFGVECHLPWCIRFPPGSRASIWQARMGMLADPGLESLPVHPLQLYFLVLSFGVFLFLLWFRRRRTYDGQVFLMFIALQESGKALLEQFRADKWSGTSETLLPAVSAALAVGAIAVLIVNALRAGLVARRPAPADAGRV